MSDDEDSNNTVNLHQSSTNSSRQEARGVSFSSSRGKIWLILVVNISIVTMFIFMSSTRFPSLHGESIVNAALEQDEEHPGPIDKNAELIFSLAAVHFANTKEPQMQETGGSSKITSTDPLDKGPDLKDATKRETEAPHLVTPAEMQTLFRDEESQDVSSETLSPSPEQPDEADYSSSTATAAPQLVDVETSKVKSKDLLDNLSVWLTSDSGVEVENLEGCLASSGKDVVACGVNSWTNQVASIDINFAASTSFRPASQKSVWIPIAPDTYNQLPTVYFTSCPMVTDMLRVHESMTVLFVLSPAQIEAGDSYTGQKFFGNSPYGQFALHGGKPSFFANHGLVESAQVIPSGQFSLVTYRVVPGYVQIKVNGGSWGGEAPVEGDDRRIRITINDVVSLGNSKGACDTNAFQGRIAEVLIYDVELDNAKIEMVEKFLHEKWWGNKPFPITTTPVPVVAESEPVVSKVYNLLTGPVAESPGNAAQVNEMSQQPSSTGKPHAEDTEQASTPAERYQIDHRNSDAPGKFSRVDEEDVNSPKFDPRVSIFEWTAPSQADPANAARWRNTVKEKVEYIRNFQLGGDVLRTLIRQHKDELVMLREELFG
ncbi:uncharacterized protein PITG_17729 [Phytophthora infestans T30-4]|uniref:Concanavalin A-like lectin/glucanase n=1 Tax=Phytophthora infestans (strain T30-4) TaxID=403677 RepID=D0NYJ2_PHYIT|nr:uncharacterized protein PITG_17729 [Phytophthora infestans T30-4]EEY68609.1 conserved hypothetical protein [Phytophthora infestans T30-4]|eukprot:XP_002997594.1 conserved hypothetical protein [Phytophthora infestans T30-4]